MKISNLTNIYPELNGTLTRIPPYVEQHYIIKEFKTGSFILRKSNSIENAYLLLEGRVNILNEFE